MSESARAGSVAGIRWRSLDAVFPSHFVMACSNGQPGCNPTATWPRRRWLRILAKDHDFCTYHNLRNLNCKPCGTLLNLTKLSLQKNLRNWAKRKGDLALRLMNLSAWPVRGGVVTVLGAYRHAVQSRVWDEQALLLTYLGRIRSGKYYAQHQIVTNLRYHKSC